MRILRVAATALWLMTVCGAHAAAADVEPLLDALRAVGPKGAGHHRAIRTWKELAEADAAQLPAVLAGLDGAGPLAANWIRCAVDAIAERQLWQGGSLPAAELERFVLDRGHDPRARRLAYEWLLRVDPTAEDRLIPGMLDDESLELRRDAVARLIDQAATAATSDGNRAEAARLYRRALTAARDLDQIRLLAAGLRGLDQQVDLARHLGFIVRWKLIGPFDNTGANGYHTVYPPEREIDPAASYRGKHGVVRWIDYETGDEYGRVDLNKGLGEEKDVAGYAMARFVSGRRREAELRVTSDNAVKLWLNGTLIDAHDVYHSGSQPDQYVSRAVLQPGRNVILVKVCQNDQTQDWARGWSFQLRVCDSTGGAILSADRQETRRNDSGNGQNG